MQHDKEIFHKVKTGATALHQSVQGGGALFIHTGHLGGNQTHAHKRQRPGNIILKLAVTKG